MRRASRSGDGATGRARVHHSTLKKLARGGSWLPLLTAVAVGCAAQEEGEPNDGDNTSGTTSGGSASGGKAGGSGAGGSSSSGTSTGGTSSAGTPSAGSTNGGSTNGGSTNGGSTTGGTAGTTNGGTAGTTNGGNGGASGAAGSGGKGGAAGAGGTAGASGSAGMSGGGSGGSGGTAPVDACDNDKKDGAETDVDCGGSVCAARCTTNQGCALVTDCQNDAAVNGTHHVCDASKCRARGCTATNCAYDLTRFIVGGATATSARGQVFVTWSATALTLDFQIHDTTPKDDSPENWKDDSVEIYLDLNHAKSATFDGDDFQINIPRVGAPQAIGTVNVGAITVMRTDDNKDYRLQVTVPWSSLNNAASQVGKTIGFSIGLNDDSSADPERDTQVMLYGTADNYMNASQFGDLQLN